MSVPDIRVGNIGTIFRFTVQDQDGTAVDLSSATTLEIRFKKPDRSVITRTAVFTTDGTNGQIQYTTVSGDLDIDGSWKRQAHVIIPAGDFWSSVVDFKVKRSLV